MKDLLELHQPEPDKPYYIGMFLCGAYQEILANFHNLYGNTNVIHVHVDPVVVSAGSSSSTGAAAGAGSAGGAGGGDLSGLAASSPSASPAPSPSAVAAAAGASFSSGVASAPGLLPSGPLASTTSPRPVSPASPSRPGSASGSRSLSPHSNSVPSSSSSASLSALSCDALLEEDQVLFFCSDSSSHFSVGVCRDMC